MLLPHDTAMRFIAGYSNLLHYAGVAMGLVPEDIAAEDFLKGGPPRLVKCLKALLANWCLVNEFEEDTEGDNPDHFGPLLAAVRGMRPARVCVLRGTEEFAILLDVETMEFYHVKSLTEPITDHVPKAYGTAQVVLMCYQGHVIHDGLVVSETKFPIPVAALRKEIEANYAQAVAEGRIVQPWDPPCNITVADLSPEALNATVANAALFHPDLSVPFIKFCTQSPDERSYLEMCVPLVDELRKGDAEMMRMIFGKGGVPDKDLFLFTLDRIEGDVKTLLRIAPKSATGRKTNTRPASKTRPAEAASPAPAKKAPVTLAERMNAATPFTATGTRELTQVLRERGAPITLKSALTIEKVTDGPDEIGIACELAGLIPGEHVMVSITHLVLPASSALFKEAIDYQRKRVKRLARLNAGY